MKLKPKKCKLVTRRVEYLGHFFSSKGIEVNPRIIESVKSFPVPRNQKQVKQFMGLCDYYRKFILNFANIAHPLYALTKLEKYLKNKLICQKISGNALN